MTLTCSDQEQSALEQASSEVNAEQDKVLVIPAIFTLPDEILLFICVVVYKLYQL